MRWFFRVFISSHVRNPIVKSLQKFREGDLLTSNIADPINLSEEPGKLFPTEQENGAYFVPFSSKLERFLIVNHWGCVQRQNGFDFPKEQTFSKQQAIKITIVPQRHVVGFRKFTPAFGHRHLASNRAKVTTIIASKTCSTIPMLLEPRLQRKDSNYMKIRALPKGQHKWWMVQYWIRSRGDVVVVVCSNI